ncbi:extracellular solute-binding protein [Jatrophihabitans cynanchi]|jgi:multiple sugar transport system substrate-binding protein|uniref:Extracellular solute-binding protein n=2 Tax=Jatrophihabitans cynanchi TaxID=2944128 RepID=A0ABY7JZD3_9ACTN|nr:extracellular solute-binding protein [Jatrophihabitans sp. SB3-54]WAX57941.1 extracellular solute-binding protein [Jatrophihabitans sp. SB3-54]
MPDPSGTFPSISRRSMLKGIAGAAGLAATPALIAACSSSGGGGAKKGSTGSGDITFGSNYSDPSTKGAFATLTQQATSATSVKINVNTVDHNTFQNNITSYLQGTPDSLCTWFAGYRMQYFAAQGLLAQIDDVWDKIGSNFNDATKSLSKGLDGHYYFVPIYNYPWVVFYNKSTFSSKGYSVPTTWDQFTALAQQMKKDGLIPIAFADKDLWPALGTFDILNLRINGYDFHMQLMQNKAQYTDPKVTEVFKHWAEILPYCQSGANGRIWQDAAKALENKQAGMMFQGSNQVAANYSAANLADLDFFPYPAINPDFGQDYMDAPADGFIMPNKGKNGGSAKKVLEYIGTGPAEVAYLKTDKWDVGLAQNIDTSGYNAIQKKSAQAIAACKNVAQFGDRDTDPAMAAALEALIQKFIDDPSDSNISSIQKSAADQAKTIFG